MGIASSSFCCASITLFSTESGLLLHSSWSPLPSTTTILAAVAPFSEVIPLAIDWKKNERLIRKSMYSPGTYPMEICYDEPLPGQAFFAQFLVSFGPPVQFLPPFTAGRWTYLDLDWTPFPQDLLHGLQTLKSLQSQSAEILYLNRLQWQFISFKINRSPVFWFFWKYFTWACLKFAGFRFGWISST